MGPVVVSTTFAACPPVNKPILHDPAFVANRQRLLHSSMRTPRRLRPEVRCSAPTAVSKLLSALGLLVEGHGRLRAIALRFSPIHSGHWTSNWLLLDQPPWPCSSPSMSGRRSLRKFPRARHCPSRPGRARRSCRPRGANAICRAACP